MRIGVNPEKGKKINHQVYHKVIVPIYIPNLEGYFKDGLKITQLCIESLILTKHNKASLTVVNNNSCKEVREYLQTKFEDGGIDHLVHHRINLGKIDAVIPIARSSQEPLITITDGDVLFRQGWMQAVEEVYDVFPEAGMVSPVPHGTTFNKFTCNTILGGLFKKELKIEKGLCDLKHMLAFAKSIGGEEKMYKKPLHLSHQMVVKRGAFYAVVGCGHFVSTLRNTNFKLAPQGLSGYVYSKNADNGFIDIPLEKSGLWRLATTGNHAWHMGNVWEPWMDEEFQNQKQTPANNKTIVPNKPKATTFGIPLRFRRFIVSQILFSNKVRPYFVKYLGLSASAKEY